MLEKIFVKGARVHNLKTVDLEIPRNQLVVFTGLSGSGKSSLAFDTIYAEGQRRYVESLSAYARQFLDQLDKPDVDSIDGLSPAISIDQKGASHNPRSSVGTVTEIYDYLRLLYSSIGTPLCPKCSQPISKQSVQEIIDAVMKMAPGTQITLFAPMVSGKKGAHLNLFEKVKQDGFSRVRVNGTVMRLDEDIKLDKNKKHDIEIVVDRTSVNDENSGRIFESVETALRQTGGVVLLENEGGESRLFSEHFACADCEISLAEISPRLFSFNSPYGACSECNGLGERLEFDEEFVIEDESLPARLATQGSLNLDDTIYGRRFELAAKEIGMDPDMPVKQMNGEQRELFLYGVYGAGGKAPLPKGRRGRWRPRAPRYWEGVIGNLRRRYGDTPSEMMRQFFEKFMSSKVCSACEGARLNKDALSVWISHLTISELCAKSVSETIRFFDEVRLSEKEREIAKLLLKEIGDRLSFLERVGLGYLSLDRRANTLSGGELQRIRLATQIGSGLTGVLYVLDEPSIGLHQRDNGRLLETLKRLRDLGNSLIVVEHDEETIQSADYVVDIGPEAGVHGGEIVFSGDYKGLLKCPGSITAAFLNGKQAIEVPKKRRSHKGQKYLEIVGASENNLKNVSVKFPLGQFIAVSGVSGSGKSTLVNEILHNGLMKTLHKSRARPGKHKTILGTENIDKLITIDQSPIGRTPRSNPATYTGVFTPIRELFASTPEAKIRGYGPGRFSFNVKGGRCEACQGDGLTKIEMHFLSDVYVTCEVCQGKRYNDQTLEVTFKGYTISDVLNMTINQAHEIFENIPMIAGKLKTLKDVGLGYIAVGQSATTLSGGEAQRIKLSRELGKRSTGKTLYLLDEPTTGLHFADVKRLLGVLNRLVDGGNTVLVIEHHLDVIKTADFVLDLGPEGGNGGGEIVASGTPEMVAGVEGSFTGRYLKEILG